MTGMHKQYTVTLVPKYSVNIARVVFLIIAVGCATIFSHMFAASWVIECVLLVFVFVACYVFNQAVRPITATTICMTKSDLMQWAAAGCPETWEIK